MPSEAFIISSAVENGAMNKSSDGSSFELQFTRPLFLPSNAYNAKLEVIQANIWNKSPNISQALGNNTFTLKDDGGTFTVMLDDGLYDLESLYDSIALKLDNHPPPNRPKHPVSDYFTFSGNNSLGKVIITFLDKDLTANPEILWSQSTVRTVLGFEEDSPTRPTTTLYTNIQTDEHNSSLVAPNPAKFNSYNSFVLHSDLVSEGIQINNTYDNIISQIQITSNVGEIENFRANDKNMFSIVNNLIGSQNQRYRARFYLTSELGIPLDTKGENYDFVILLSWLEH